MHLALSGYVHEENTYIIKKRLKQHKDFEILIESCFCCI